MPNKLLVSTFFPPLIKSLFLVLAGKFAFGLGLACVVAARGPE
jgi:hypothetical protein